MKNVIVALALIINSINLVNAQGTPTIVLKTSLPVGSEISMAIGTRNDTTIQIDWGNGTLVEYTTGWAAVMMYHPLNGGVIKIYGPTIHYFGAGDIIIDTADFSNCPELTDLLMQNCGMSSINISENSKLVNCWIVNNKLKILDIKNDTSLYTLRCDQNQLTTLDVSNSKKLNELGLNYNKFSSIDLTNNTLLTYFDCGSNNFSTLDITKNTLLGFFNCGDNNIQTLDVSGNTELSYLHCYKNPLKNLDVSKNLKLAYIDISQTQLTNIDLSNNTELFHFYCQFNIISNLDFSKNTKLERAWCEYGSIETINLGSISSLKEFYCFNNKLSSIDVSNVPSLREFRCNNNQLTSVDISKNHELVWLYCNSNKITSLSLPANPIFMLLDCRYNLLTNIDVSKSTGLKYLRCIDNNLTSLDLSANDSLLIVRCDSNYLTIASLPLKKDRWTAYRYQPQKHLNLFKKIFEPYEVIDLKNQVSRAGKISNFIWKTISGNKLVEGTDYVENSGVFAFLISQTDSVYCEITNETFPGLILETSRFIVLSPTSINVSAAKASVFPNPFTDMLKVESVEPIRQIEILSIAGNKLYGTYVNGLRRVSVPASDLPSGILILKVKGYGYTHIVKVVKK